MGISLLDFNNFFDSTSWFHPGVTCLKDGGWLATMQSVNGNDYYGEPHFSLSDDNGKTWTVPQPIPALRTLPFEKSGYFQAILDIRPFTDPTDGTVFVFGATSYYSSKGHTCYETDAPEFPRGISVYATWRRDSGWSDRKILPFPDYDREYRSACIQVAFLPNGDFLVPIYTGHEELNFGEYKSARYASVVAKYHRVGDELQFIERSQFFENPVNRGLPEPSVIALPQGGYALTIRAEDGRGYVSVSEDGINWSEKLFWRWEDGTPIETSTTQQHWFTLGDKTFLAYTRNDGTNEKVFRFRAPLYAAEAIPGKGILLNNTEKIIFPRQLREGVEALYGNFHCTNLDKNTALVTDAALWELQGKEYVNTVMNSKTMAALVTP